MVFSFSKGLILNFFSCVGLWKEPIRWSRSKDSYGNSSSCYEEVNQAQLEPLLRWLWGWGCYGVRADHHGHGEAQLRWSGSLARQWPEIVSRAPRVPSHDAALPGPAGGALAMQRWSLSPWLRLALGLHLETRTLGQLSRFGITLGLGYLWHN